MNLVSFEKDSRFRILFPRYRAHAEEKKVSVSALLVAHTPFAVALNELFICIGDIRIKPHFKRQNLKEKAQKHVCLVSFEVSLEEARSLPIHSTVFICIKNSEGAVGYRQVSYNSFIPRYIAAHGPYLNDEEHRTVVYFRQKVDGALVLTVRHRNVTDSFSSQIKLFFAFILSYVAPMKRPVLVFEKNASKYEESGKAIFQELVDRGYENVFFIIAKESAEQLNVNERYSSKFVYRHTLRHYFYFFRSRTFLGSEAIAHALELRCQNPFAQWQMKNRKNTEVFLQHGVMYMVSLDSPERTSFQRKAFRGRVRVVVSSEKEAEHFMELAEFNKEEMIIAGLAKFDSSYMKPEADKILIMPTWRIWEFNTMRLDPSLTDYVAMIKDIERAIPPELQDKVITRYHPLFQDVTFGGNLDAHQESLDELLRDVKLLITDYSSISFDAFYRGANVVFYWKDLNKCMKHYGEPTKLMLNEGNAFGDICWDENQLKNHILKNYTSSQSSDYRIKYREIVNYYDGRNTQRIIDSLELEGVLRK